LIFGLALVVAAAFGAPPQARPAGERPVYESGVELVAVPVFVTDRDGRAVAGLTREQFRIEDQGRSVSVVTFQEVIAGAPPASSPAHTAIAAAGHRQFVLLFDLSFTTLAGLARARQSALEFVGDGFAQGDLVAVATYSSTGLRWLLGFTSDRSQVRRAIEELRPDHNRPTDPLGLAYELGVDLEPAPGTGTPGAQDSELDDWIESQVRQAETGNRRQYKARVEDFLNGLRELGEMLAAIEGRKQVVLLSAGFDPRTLSGESATSHGQWDVINTGGDDPLVGTVGRDALDGLLRELALADTVIHAIDVTGLRAAGPDASAAYPSQARSWGHRDSLALLAVDSGGQFVKDANDLRDALQEVLDASRSFYVLGFEPSGERKAGVSRKLKVRVSVPDVHVSARAAYRLPDPGGVDAKRRRTLAAESIAKGLQGGAIRLDVVACPYRNAQGDLGIPLVLQIDGQSLLAPPQPSADTGPRSALVLEIYGYALDAQGAPSETSSRCSPGWRRAWSTRGSARAGSRCSPPSEPTLDATTFVSWCATPTAGGQAPPAS